MQKSLSLIILIASLGILSGSITAGDVTSVSPTSSTLQSFPMNIQLTVRNVIAANTEIIFSLSLTTPIVGDPSTTVSNGGNGLIVGINPIYITFVSAGFYYVYLKDLTRTLKQSNITFEINLPSNIILNISPPNGVVNVAIKMSFILPNSNLINDDTPTFSKLLTTVDLSKSTEKYVMTIAPITNFFYSFTFTSTGTYNLFLTRNRATSQQGCLIFSLPILLYFFLSNFSSVTSYCYCWYCN